VAEFSDPTPDDPGNLLIEGDNRQAMVSLLPQYAGKVDVCLIDPPYNTGKRDFRYNDARFNDPDADTQEGVFVSAEDGGRHAKWLNQMAPTLGIIKDLMAPHGVVFAHINDIELPRLLLLMEEIFGEKNRLGVLVWKGATDNNPGRVVIEHEYIVAWALSAEALETTWRGPVAEQVKAMSEEFARQKAAAANLDELRMTWKAWIKAHKNELYPALAKRIEVDAVGPYRPDGDLANPGKKGYDYDVPHPLNGRPVKKPLMGWRFPEASMKALIAEDRIAFRKDETFTPGLKRYLSEDEPDRLRSVLTHINAQVASNEIERLFPENPLAFSKPKPTELEEHLLSFAAGPDAIVLDCFAGSGTTGHAVMRVNARDNGSRRFILIEEGNDGDAYATSLTAERLRRARVQERLAGGFTFMRVGPRINLEAFEKLQHRHLVQTILQTDATGRGGGIKPVKDGALVIGYNVRREAICLHFDPREHSPITGAVLREMYAEADRLGLQRPLRVYGESCEIFGSESFRFFKLPDEVLNNLTLALGGAR